MVPIHAGFCVPGAKSSFLFAKGVKGVRSGWLTFSRVLCVAFVAKAHDCYLLALCALKPLHNHRSLQKPSQTFFFT